MAVMQPVQKKVLEYVGLSSERVLNRYIDNVVPSGMQIATGFQVMNNPDPKARNEIENEIAFAYRFIFVVFDRHTKVKAQKWHSVNLDSGNFTQTDFDEKRGLYEQVFFSKEAVKAIRRGRPVALTAERDFFGYKLRLEVSVPAYWFDQSAKVALISSETSQAQERPKLTEGKRD